MASKILNITMLNKAIARFNSYFKLSIISTMILINSCSSYSLNKTEILNISNIDAIKRGETCSKNLFGSFTLPYFGDTAIKLSGDESVISAMKNGLIQDVYAIDRLTQNYLLFSKRCTIVFGY